MAEQLSGTIVVIIIAVGVQAFIILFILAKRQISRFALRNKRGPYTSIGQGGPKYLKREAERCLEYIRYIRHEPEVNVSINQSPPEHYFRAHAIAKYNHFEREIATYGSNCSRLPGSSVRTFLMNCQNQGPLLGVSSIQIHELCDLYEHARHHYEDFADDKLREFTEKIESMQKTFRENFANRPTNPSILMKGGKNNQPRNRTNKKNQSSNIKNLTVTFSKSSKQPKHESEVRLTTAMDTSNNSSV